VNDKLTDLIFSEQPSGVVPPRFIEPEGARTLPFCRKMMNKADGFTSSFRFYVHVLLARAKKTARRRPTASRCEAIDALLQAMCFWYDPANNCVRRSPSELAVDCGLATKLTSGKLCIAKVTRILTALDKGYGLIVYNTRKDPNNNSAVKASIWFTPALFEALDISSAEWSRARHSAAKKAATSTGGHVNG